MGEVREWWQTVYAFQEPGSPRPSLGLASRSREAANLNATCEADPSSEVMKKCQMAFRIHVRLKPEGAPRRYADTMDRWWWENAPAIARRYGNDARLASPRTPKIEERT